LATLKAKSAIPKLREAVHDQDAGVVMSAAKALIAMDNEYGYGVYYALVTGERKSGESLIGGQEQQMEQILHKTALDHLQSTIQLDPEFADGHNDLGVVLGKLGNAAEAREEFQRAIKLAPAHQLALSNLCVSLFELQHYEEVVPLAHRALKTQPNLLPVRYLLGMSLIADHGDRQEALDNLELAAPQFPEARLTPSTILLQTGRRAYALSELEKFLHSVPKTDPLREKAEAQVSQLRR
jgi:tetratricopeptide (TPR) repeat protein